MDHLSRLKHADFNYAPGRRGVFSTGRNVSGKLVPLALPAGPAANFFARAWVIVARKWD